MNPEELLQHIATLIENRPFSIKKKYHICFFEGEFRCLPVTHTDRPHTVFLAALDSTLGGGLNNHQWDNLLHKLTMFQKGQRK